MFALSAVVAAGVSAEADRAIITCDGQGPCAIDPRFDELVQLAASICSTSFAAIHFVEKTGHHHDARSLTSMTRSPREVALGIRTMQAGDVVIVNDLFDDPAINELGPSTQDADLRFYAGVPLKDAAGDPVGTLSVFDEQPKPNGLSTLQISTLSIFARQIVTLVELMDTHDIHQRAAAVLTNREAQYQALMNSIPHIAWSADANGRIDYFNTRWQEFCGNADGLDCLATVKDLIHPEDAAGTLAKWTQSLRSTTPFECEYRLRRSDGTYCWKLGRAIPTFNLRNEVTRWFGTSTDISEQKRLASEQSLLADELLHRIKNIFAVISSLVSLSAGNQPQLAGFAKSVHARIGALANAHQFAHPHSWSARSNVKRATLHEFLTELFQPYASERGAARVMISGDDLRFSEHSAATMALMFHEMATNAAKYGALSTQGGSVLLTTTRRDDRFIFDWQEIGGPPVLAKPDAYGFGSTLVAMTVERQLGGTLSRMWHEHGLQITADLPTASLAPAPPL